MPLFSGKYVFLKYCRDGYTKKVYARRVVHEHYYFPPIIRHCVPFFLKTIVCLYDQDKEDKEKYTIINYYDGNLK